MGTAGQWKRDDESRVCKECVGRHEQSGHPWQCHICKRWQPTTAFYGKWRSNGASLLRVFLNCKETKRCHKRGELKEEAGFSAATWRIRHQCRRTCKTCSRKCASCATSRPKRRFARHARRRHGFQDGKQTCDVCLAEADLKQIATRGKVRLARTRAKRKQQILAAVWRQVGEMRRTQTCGKDLTGPSEKAAGKPRWQMRAGRGLRAEPWERQRARYTPNVI